MKKSFLVVVFLIGYVSFSCAQPKSILSEVDKLEATAKIWGFLKYYHPNVANGSRNWDEQLFQICQETEKVKTKDEFSKVIDKWILSLGEIKKQHVDSISKNDCFLKNLNFSWFKNKSLFTNELSKKLEFIKENKFYGQNFYVAFQDSNPNISPLQFTNEIKYGKFDWADKKMRLLALFKYWNYVEYFFPYKYQMDQNWDKALREILPKIINPKTELDFHLAMRELSVKLNDSHASIGTGKMFDKFGDKFVPADFKIIDKKAVVINLKNDSLANLSDLKVGDVILAVDGKSIEAIISENSKYVEGSNQMAILRNFYWAIFNGKSDSIQIDYTRQGQKESKFIRRYLYHDLRAKTAEKDKWKFLNKDVAYVNLGEVTEDDVPFIMDTVKNSKAIIFDLRNNALGTNYLISEYLNPEPKEFVKFLDADLNSPGRYIWRQEIEKCGKKNPDYYKGRVVILVNEVTQSHGEYSAMSLQTAPKAVVIGSQTAGADGGVVKFEIIRGFVTQFTSYGVFYPNKKETQRKGIIPDIKVNPTILGIQEGRDEILERALIYTAISEK
ncbi:S41 family peptidase [Flavobacterium sp. T12S277]|uniref:S41 family peptidase n=1 Tax=Flavobacterium sp. T12S277 TaxID=3402752 RepID=UPI003ADA25F1